MNVALHCLHLPVLASGSFPTWPPLPPLPFQPQPPPTHTCLQWTNWQRKGAETLWAAAVFNTLHCLQACPIYRLRTHSFAYMYVCVFVCLHEFEWWRKRPIITTEMFSGSGWYLIVSPLIGKFSSLGTEKLGSLTPQRLFHRWVYTCSLSGISFKSYRHHISQIPYHCILIHCLTVTHKEVKMCFRLLLFRWIYMSVTLNYTSSRWLKGP